MKKLFALLLLVPLLASPAAADLKKLDPKLSKEKPAPPEDPNQGTKISMEAREARIGPDTTLHPMVLAELAFARTSTQKGMRKAFLTYLAEDSVIFRPKPVAGKQWFTDRPNITTQLSWEPTYAEVASSGDLGFSTGPFHYQEPTTGTDKAAPVQYGHFVSVWEKQIAGWRVVVDHGIMHQKPRKKAKPQFEIREGEPAGTLTEAISTLSVIDRKFANVASLDELQELYSTHGAEDLRIYRRNFLPINGKKHALKALGQLSILVSGDLEGAGLSKDGDLAYSYGMGIMGKLDKEKRTPATYLRLWRNDGDQGWKLMLDLVVPLPSEKGAPTS